MIALGIALAMAGPMPDTFNGVWVSPLGFAFAVVNPYTITTTLAHRHYSAFKIESSGSDGFSGQYDASRDLKIGYISDPQVDAQYRMLTDLATSFTGKIEVPKEVPCVIVSDSPKPQDTGTIKIDRAADTSLHMVWTNQGGQVDFAGNLAKLGGDEFVDFNGSFVDRDITISLADVGKGPMRSLVGTVKLNGVTYRLKGYRLWTRGNVSLYPQTGDDVLGGGWIEWAPSTNLCLSMKGSKPQPTDQILAYIQTTKNGFTTGATHRLVSPGK